MVLFPLQKSHLKRLLNLSVLIHCYLCKVFFTLFIVPKQSLRLHHNLVDRKCSKSIQKGPAKKTWALPFSKIAY